MVTRTLHIGLLASWFLAGHHVIAEGTTTPESSTSSSSSTTSSPPTVSNSSPFISPSLNGSTGGLSESAKISISIGVTLVAILLIGYFSILCVIRRRNQTLLNMHAQSLVADGIDLRDCAAKTNPNNFYMSAPSTAHTVGGSADPFAYPPAAAYPPVPVPEAVYAPPGQVPVISYTAPYTDPNTLYATAPPPPDGGFGAHTYAPYPPHIQTHFPTPQTTTYSAQSPTDYQPQPFPPQPPYQQPAYQQPHFPTYPPTYPYQPPCPTQQQQQQPQLQLSPCGYASTLNTISESDTTTPIQGDSPVNFLPDYAAAASAYYNVRPNTIVELPQQHRVVELMGEGHQHLNEAP